MRRNAVWYLPSLRRRLDRSGLFCGRDRSIRMRLGPMTNYGQVFNSKDWPENTPIAFMVSGIIQRNSGAEYRGWIIHLEDSNQIPVRWKWNKGEGKKMHYAQGASPPDSTYIDWECLTKQTIQQWRSRNVPVPAYLLTTNADGISAQYAKLRLGHTTTRLPRAGYVSHITNK